MGRGSRAKRLSIRDLPLQSDLSRPLVPTLPPPLPREVPNEPAESAPVERDDRPREADEAAGRP